jgi:hypothetical protein
MRHVQDDRTRFDTDELLQNAVLHWIEIIGEAARGVSDKVRDAHPEVPIPRSGEGRPSQDNDREPDRHRNATSTQATRHAMN